LGIQSSFKPLQSSNNCLLITTVVREARIATVDLPVTMVDLLVIMEGVPITTVDPIPVLALVLALAPVLGPIRGLVPDRTGMEVQMAMGAAPETITKTTLLE
jgi:hypothetical protein